MKITVEKAAFTVKAGRRRLSIVVDAANDRIEVTGGGLSMRQKLGSAFIASAHAERLARLFLEREAEELAKASAGVN